MRLALRGGQLGKQHAVEAEHVRRFGERKPYHRIAIELYGPDFPTARAVQAEIKKRYGVEIAEKTAGNWLRTGQAELEKEQVDAPVAAATA